VSTVLPTVIYELGLTGTAVAQLMTMVSFFDSQFIGRAYMRLQCSGILTFTDIPSPQPTYAFGCTCLVLIGYLIHRKFVSPWLAAIASMSSLQSFLPCHVFIQLTMTLKSRNRRPPLLHPPPSPPLAPSKIPRNQHRGRLLRLRLPCLVA